MRRFIPIFRQRATRRRRGRALTAAAVVGVLAASSSILASEILTSEILASEGAPVHDAADNATLERAVRVSPPVTVVPPPPPPTVPPSSPPGLSAEVQAVLSLTNEERSRAGMAPLTFHADLAAAAEMHGNDQRNQPCAFGYLTHTGSDGSSPGDRISRTGLRVSNWAENIACGYSSAESVMAAWMNSSGHRNNILNPALTHIGISLTYSDTGRSYWVQDFAVPRG